MNILKNLDNKDIGRRLEDLRKSKKSIKASKNSNTTEMSQDELIQELGLDCKQATISRWEHGANSISLDAIYKYSQYFHKSIDYILTSEEFKVDPEDSSMVKTPYTISELFRLLVDFMQKTPFNNFSFKSSNETLQELLDTMYGEENARLIKENMDEFIENHGIEQENNDFTISLSTEYKEIDMINEYHRYTHPEPYVDAEGNIDESNVPQKSLIIAFLSRYQRLKERLQESKEDGLSINILGSWLYKHYDLASGYSVEGYSLSEKSKPYRLNQNVQDSIYKCVGEYYDEELDELCKNRELSFEEAIDNILHLPD